MELEQAKKRVKELRAIIEKNNRLYYDQDAPELEDFEYDALTRELKELEARFPQLVTATSPTQKVGGTASSKLPKVTHAVKMESLLDAFSFDELRDFDRRVREAGVEPEYVVEIKIDGLSCSLEYENGQLVRASTRGDGVVGEDVTANVRAIRSIPKTLKDAPEFLEVRGEVYMPHKAFQHLCAEQELQGAAPFKNPRNAAAGSLRQKDARITGSRGLSIFVFNVQQIRGKTLAKHSESLDYLKSLGLPVSPRYHVVHDIEDAIAEIENIGQNRSGRERTFAAHKRVRLRRMPPSETISARQDPSRAFEQAGRGCCRGRAPSPRRRAAAGQGCRETALAAQLRRDGWLRKGLPQHGKQRTGRGDA